VAPQAVHEWYLAVYVDAIEWVELPNTLGMSQAADGGLMASKPYIASGKYIERMSAGSLCARCASCSLHAREGRPAVVLVARDQASVPRALAHQRDLVDLLSLPRRLHALAVR
jgi:hypothetical protein